MWNKVDQMTDSAGAQVVEILLNYLRTLGSSGSEVLSIRVRLWWCVWGRDVLNPDLDLV